MLHDDLGLEPVENITPVVNDGAARRFGPHLAEQLDAVSAALSTPDLRAMNGAVAAGASYANVAGGWLDDHQSGTG